MPVQKQQSLLAKTLGKQLAEAHKQHKDAPVELGQQRLPAGIENGVAQLRDMKFSVYEKGTHAGKPFFMASGVCVEPKVFNGTTCEGRRTNGITPLPLCDTPEKSSKKTFSDHWADFLNIMKMFKVDMPPDRISPTETQEAAALRIENYFIAAVEALKKQQPYFAFRTWQGQKQTTGPYAGKEPLVNEQWQGVIDYTPSANGDTAVVDDTAPPTDMQPNEPFTEPEQTAEHPTDATSTGGEEVDIATLLAVADADPQGTTPEGKQACEYVQNAALAAGVTEDQIAATQNWSEVWALIPTGDAEPQAEPEAPPAPPPPPKKGDKVKYASRDAKGAVVVDPKSKKPVAAQEYEVTSSDPKSKTVTLTNVKTKGPLVGADKKLLKVKWEYLE